MAPGKARTRAPAPRDSGIETALRIDKWLWQARLCKTRALAARLCEAGTVRIEGRKAKPAHEVRPGEEITIELGRTRWRIRVAALGSRRGPAAEARGLYVAVERGPAAVEEPWHALLSSEDWQEA